MSDRRPSIPRRSRQARLPALLLLAVLAVLPVAAPAAPPDVPSAAEIDARVAAIQALPLPTEGPTGEDASGEDAVRIGIASAESRLQRSFLELQQSLPGWHDEGIVIAAGRHRLETVAEGLARPDLLRCDQQGCRLSAPLAVEAGAMLVIDGLTVELDQPTGTVIVAFGDLFVDRATIEGRNGAGPAVTDGADFRPFIVAYDESRTVIRDSRLANLGFDTFSTTGLAVMTLSRDDPTAHPELAMVGTVVEDVYDGVFVRAGGRVALLRNTVTDAGRHGIVARDGSENVLIAENVVTGSGAAADNGNGIVVSRGVSGAVVAGNRVEGSAASAILVERDAADLALGGNQLVGSGRDGLIVYESSDVDILGNGIARSARSGIRVRASDGVRIEGNALEDNARTGVDAHDWSGASREPNDEETPLIRSTVVTVTGNRFAGNERGPCLFEGVVTVLPAGASDC